MIRISRRSAATSEMSFSTVSDIAFLLIIFFMVTSSFIVSEGFHLILPDSSKKPVVTSTENVLVLTVKKSGDLYAEGKKIKPERAESFLSEIFASKSKKSVLLKPEKDALYGSVVRVIEMIKKTGFGSLSLKMI